MKAKKAPFRALFAAILCACLTLPAAAQTFPDVPLTHWAYANIEEAVSDGAVKGYQDGSFAPSNPLSLAHFTVILTRSFYGDELERIPESASASWYGAAESVARAHGLLTGVESGMNDPLSRYQMALEIYNFLKARGFAFSESAAQKIAASIEDWDAFPAYGIRNAVSCVYSLGILGGYADGKFHGENILNRAQAAAIYCRVKNVLKNFASPLSDHWTPDDDSSDWTPDDDSNDWTPDDSQPETVSDETQAFREEVLRLVNEARAKEGLNALTLSEKLTEAAQIRAEELPDTFSHTRPDGSSCFTVLSEVGVRYMATGENIAAGQRTPGDVMNSWMNSSGHRANILSKDYGELGVGVCKASDGYGVYWVQLFTD